MGGITMEKTYKIRVYDIDYCVEAQDLDYLWPENQDWDEEDYDKKIAQIKKELPQDLLFSITCGKDEIEDNICDAIGNETGWLVNGFSYDIL